MEILQEMMELSEPGNDWADTEDIVSSDESFEEHRRGKLREAEHELSVYVMVLDHRLNFGTQYSGLDLIKEQEISSWRGDIQLDEEEGSDTKRLALIRKLEEICGRSFRGNDEESGLE